MSTRQVPNKLHENHAVPYETYHEQRYPYGQVLETPDGRLFRFAKMGATAGVAAKLYQSEVPDAQFDTLVVATGAAVGGSSLIITNGTTAVTENEFTEGTVTVETAVGLGAQYPIRDNSSAANGAALTVTLMDGVTFQSVVTAGTHAVTITKNPWLDIIIHPSPPTAMVIGVPVSVIPATAYGWVQTQGFGSVLADASGTAIVIGQEVRPSEDDDGAVATLNYDEAAQADRGVVGVAMDAGVDAQFFGVFLKLE